MGLAVRIIFSFVLFLSLTTNSNAAWQDPVDTISGIWGSEPTQFGLHQGDTIAYDRWPFGFQIYPPDFILIADVVNERTAVYKLDGTFVEIVSWQKVKKTDGGYKIVHTKYNYEGGFAWFDTNNTFWTEDEGTYRKYDSVFNLIQTATRPLELGTVTVKRQSENTWQYEVEYPEGIYIYEGSEHMLKEDGIARINQNLIMQNRRDKVYAYKVGEEIPVAEGEKQKYRLDKVADWVKPDSSGSGDEPIVKPDGTVIGYRRPTSYNIYGGAVIGPDGSIYTWMRSEMHYKILKWKWVE